MDIPDKVREDLRLRGPAVQRSILRWAAGHTRNFPWRSPGRAPYEVLIAEVLLKRTTASAVARVYESFLAQFCSVQGIAHADAEMVASALSTVGLQRQRAKAIKALAEYLVEEEGGDVPRDLLSLLKVPGLGEYSARAVLSFGLGVPVGVLDANVERVLHRVFQSSLSDRPSRPVLQALVNALLPEAAHREFNFGLLDLGALVCRYVEPRCEQCPLGGLCDFYGSGQSAGPASKLSTRLREVRIAKGLSLTCVAQEAGVAKLTIINIEASRTVPQLATIRKLAMALGVEPSDLL